MRYRSTKHIAVSCLGFTLIEIIAVLVLLSILAVFAAAYSRDLQENARMRVAQNLLAAAQTQLSLEFSRRAVAGLDLETGSQNICNWVIIDSPDIPASLLCTGNINGDVAITATIDGKSVNGAWNSPLSDGS